MHLSNGKTFLILKAVDFAARKHQGQKRKDEAESPYINHPITVALLLAEVGGIDDDEVLVAALLHDTLEDTKTTPEELESEFGSRVLLLVEEVTDDKSLPKDERKRLQIEHAPGLSPDAALIKLADKIANVVDVAGSPPSDWSFERRREYLDWAEAVVNSSPKVNPSLERYFYKVLKEGLGFNSHVRNRG